MTVERLKRLVAKAIPRLRNKIDRCMVAVNHEYAENEVTVTHRDEIVFIPPVSGGQGTIFFQQFAQKYMHRRKFANEGENNAMSLTMTKAAAQLYKQEMHLKAGDFVRFYVRYGGT